MRRYFSVNQLMDALQTFLKSTCSLSAPFVLVAESSCPQLPPDAPATASNTYLTSTQNTNIKFQHSVQTLIKVLACCNFRMSAHELQFDYSVGQPHCCSVGVFCST